MKTGFDSKLYMKKQYEHILERIDMAGGKLYLEFGGKLFDDLHASRVLPGFDCNAKIKLLQMKMKEAFYKMTVNKKRKKKIKKILMENR